MMSIKAKSDIYAQTGRIQAEKFRKHLEKDINKDELGMDKLIDSSVNRVAKSIAQSLRAKAMHRKKKAEKHAKTKDLFE